MNRVLSLIIILIICLGITFCFTEKIVFSENENRNLSIFPEINFENLFENNLTSKIDIYINDHFPFRDVFLKIKTKVELFMGNSLINGVYVTDDYLFLKYEQNLEIESIVNNLNLFYDNNKDVDMNLLLVPSSSYINKGELSYFSDVTNEEKDLEYVENNLLFENIDVVENLLNFNERYDVYFKGDHHYSIYGAYAVYKSFCESNDIEFNEDIKFTKVSDEFLGTLTSKVNIFDYSDDLYFYKTNDVTVNYVNENRVENTMYDYSFLDKKDKYSFFFGGNHSLIKISSEIKNEKNILIVKDSFANSFIPFLTNDYENIYVIDLRFYNLSVSEFIKENNIEKVLFLYSSTGFNSSSSLNLLR